MLKTIIKSFSLALLLLFLFFFILPITTKDYSPEPTSIIDYYLENKDSLNYIENEVVVQFNKNNDFENYLITNYNFEITTIFDETKLIKFSDSYTMLEILKKLNNYSEIDYAEPNYIYETQGNPHHEPFFNNQWGLKDYDYGIRLLSVWQETLGSEEIIVGVVDTGIDYTHPDLANNIWINENEIKDNGVDDDENGFIDDYNGWNFNANSNEVQDNSGHGTGVAGVIAAEVNGYGITGVAPNIKIMALRVSDDEGNNIMNNYVLAAIQYGIDHGVKIFNLSIITNQPSAAFANLIANNPDIIFVCGAGNESNNNDYTNAYPANYDYPNVISVGAINQEGQLADFSHYGPNSVHLVAPGVAILSTYPRHKDSEHANFQGTSFSAPHVSGIAALMLSKDPSLTASEIRERLIKSSIYSANLKNKIISEGYVNANGAFRYKKGDVLGNGTVTIADLVKMSRHLAGLDDIDITLRANGDLIDNNDITIADLVKLSRHLAGLEDL